MKHKLVKIWGDVINLREFYISTIVMMITTFGGYFLMINQSRSFQLLGGLLGAIVGFVIMSIMIKPKREIKES